MMNDEEEFSDCLECIGFDETARDFVENAGLSTVNQLMELGPRQLTALFPYAACYKPKAADREERVNVPYTSVLKLQALRAWADYRSRRGQFPPPLILKMKRLPKISRTGTKISKKRRRRQRCRIQASGLPSKPDSCHIFMTREASTMA